MKTKVVLGSVGAVVLLILLSFMNVIGVQSTTSGTVNQSPLFCIRTQTAINGDSQRTLATEYLNKGEKTLAISPSHQNDALSQRLIDKIRRMNDVSLHHFIQDVLHQMSSENFRSEISPLEIEITLHQIRENPDLLRSSIRQKESKYSYTAPSCMQCTIGNWIPGCFLSGVIGILLRMLSTLIDVVVNLQTALGIGSCGTYCCTIDHGCTFFPGS